MSLDDREAVLLAEFAVEAAVSLITFSVQASRPLFVIGMTGAAVRSRTRFTPGR